MEQNGRKKHEQAEWTQTQRALSANLENLDRFEGTWFGAIESF